MPPRTAKQATTPPPAETDTEYAEPPYYTATEDLYVGHPEAGAMPQLAYRAGDRVYPDVVAPNGWEGKVAVPDHFEGQLAPLQPPAPPPSEPAAPASAPPTPQGTAPPADTTSPKE